MHQYKFYFQRKSIYDLISDFLYLIILTTVSIIQILLTMQTDISLSDFSVFQVSLQSYDTFVYIAMPFLVLLFCLVLNSYTKQEMKAMSDIKKSKKSIHVETCYYFVLYCFSIFLAQIIIWYLREDKALLDSKNTIISLLQFPLYFLGIIFLLELIFLLKLFLNKKILTLIVVYSIIFLEIFLHVRFNFSIFLFRGIILPVKQNVLLIDLIINFCVYLLLIILCETLMSRVLKKKDY